MLVVEAEVEQILGEEAHPGKVPSPQPEGQEGLNHKVIFNNNDPCFVACLIENKIHEWQEITSDKTILDIVKNGYCIEFKGSVTYQPTYNSEQRLAIDKDILKLLKAEVIEIVSPQSDQFVSPIFTRPKSDGSVRLILNLKIFSEFVEYQHFKMDTFHLVLPSITNNCFMSRCMKIP